MECRISHTGDPYLSLLSVPYLWPVNIKHQVILCCSFGCYKINPKRRETDNLRKNLMLEQRSDMTPRRLSVPMVLVRSTATGYIYLNSVLSLILKSVILSSSLKEKDKFTWIHPRLKHGHLKGFIISKKRGKWRCLQCFCPSSC